MTHIRSRELVESALAASDRGVPDADNAAAHGVAIKTIRRWRRVYQREGKTREGSAAACPRCNAAPLDEAAYAELFGWYLGDGWLERHRGSRHRLHIFNDATYTRLNARIADLMRRVKPEARPHTRAKPGCVVTTVGWNHWPCLFPQHGPGRKHERRLVLEPWQEDIIADHPAPFLRGLLHSDGCRVDNWATQTVAGEVKRYAYGRWQFVNHSEDILKWCTDALDRLDIPWRRSGRHTVSVSRRQAVARLDDLVGLKT